MVTAIFSFLIGIFLFTGVYVLAINPKKSLNRLFFIITLCLIAQCIVGTIVQLPSIRMNQHAVESWFILGSSSFYFTLFFLVIFYIRLTEFPRLRWYTVVLLLIPPLYISYKVNTLEFYNIIIHDNILYFNNFSPFMHQITIFVNLYMAFMFILIFRWLIKSSKKKNKKIAFILLFSQFLSMVLISIDQYVLFYLTELKSVQIPGMYLPYFLIWFLGIGYTMVRFRFLVITPGSASQDILKNIDESVFLLGNDYNLITVNRTAEETLQIESHVTGVHASKIIKEYHGMKSELENLKQSSGSDFACRLNFKKTDNTLIYMDAKVKLIRDEFNDILGTLIIAKPVKELMQMREYFKISEREAGVVQLVITGKTNIEIADELYITERTVKTHLTNIFNKMGIDNKIQLIILLKDFNLIPAKQAEETKLFN
jgi:DNA-binding CsgD family transcriptional regulator